MKRKREGKKWHFALSVFGLVLTSTIMANAGDIGSENWQQKYNPSDSSWNNGFFEAVGFNTDGSVLASGFRGEADSASAVGVRYNAADGAVLDSPAEWFKFEYTWSDYAQDRFADQYIDSNGDIYFVGMSYSASFNSFSARYNVPNIWKYDSTYTYPYPANPDRPLWRKYHYTAGTPANNGQFYDMAVDGSGNIYAVGYFNNLSSTTSSRDWIIYKYDTDGNIAAGFPLALNLDDLHDYANGVAVDSEGNFIVVGSVTVDAGTDHTDMVVRKYNSSGTLLWETAYDHSNLNDSALGVVVDSEDNIIVRGYRTNDSPSSDNDWYIVKYAKDGDGSGGATVIWEQFWDDGNAKNGIARSMVLDSRDNIYIIGRQAKDSTDPLYSDRYRPVLQYRDGETGTLLKQQNIELNPTDNDRPDIEHDYLKKLALKDGQLVIAGYTQQDGGYSVTKGRTGRVVMLDLVSDVTPSTTGKGSISPSIPVENIAYGTTTDFTLVPDPNSHVAGITGTCPAGSLSDNGDGSWKYTTGPITFDCTVIANFSSFPWNMFLPAIIEGNVP